jgi:hypothetical protein
MDKLSLSEKLTYDDFIEMGKDVYLYPGRFYRFFDSKAFIKALFQDKPRYEQYLALKKMNLIPDVFLFKMSYVLNPYMSLRYHHFNFRSYQELGQTILSYGPVVDVYLKDLLIYHLLSEYMVRMRDDFNQAADYNEVRRCEREALEDQNLAYWDLGFALAHTKTLTYDKKQYSDPKQFFNEKLVLSSLIPFSSDFLSDRLVLCWLKLNGYEGKVSSFLSLASVSDEKEAQAEEIIGQDLEEKFKQKPKE